MRSNRAVVLAAEDGESAMVILQVQLFPEKQKPATHKTQTKEKVVAGNRPRSRDGRSMDMGVRIEYGGDVKVGTPATFGVSTE